eukprot:691316-Rhodomonas_salina.1
MVLVPGRTERASRTFERPKSATLTRWSCETSRFNGLKSPVARSTRQVLTYAASRAGAAFVCVCVCMQRIHCRRQHMLAEHA